MSKKHLKKGSNMINTNANNNTNNNTNTNINNNTNNNIIKFKKIYIEITNICNLNCSFCSPSNRPQKEMSVTAFDYILSQIDKHTDYIYLHVKGEPLTHHKLDEILSITQKHNKKVCITTNGVFLKEKLNILKKYNNIYQINISLHSENNKTNYIEDILSSTAQLSSYISYRFWTLDSNNIDAKTQKYLEVLKKAYNISEVYDGVKLKDKVYLSLDNKFTWPDINNNYYQEKGTCLGGKTHLAILQEGTVTICCLDSEGKSNLGNIYTTPFEEILNSSKYQNTIQEFKNNKAYLEICKHCTYKDKFCK